MVSSIERFYCIQDSQLGPSGVLYREVPTVYRTASQLGPSGVLYREVPTVYRTASWVPVVSCIERFHCIQDSQLGPSGVLYREVPLYTDISIQLYHTYVYVHHQKLRISERKP